MKHHATDARKLLKFAFAFSQSFALRSFALVHHVHSFASCFSSYSRSSTFAFSFHTILMSGFDREPLGHAHPLFLKEILIPDKRHDLFLGVVQNFFNFFEG